MSLRAKRFLKPFLALLLRSPLLKSAVLAGLLLGIKALRGWLRTRPWRYLTLYKILRMAEAAPAVKNGAPPSSRGATTGFEAELDRQIRDFRRDDPNLWLVKNTNRLIAEYEASQRVERAKALPLRLSLELTSACNLRCRMCTQSLQSASKRYYLDPELLERVEPALRAATTVAMTGWGETLLHPEFPAIFRRVKACGPNITMVTNGLLLNKDTARLLVEQGLSDLTVSLDAFLPDTYAFVRGVDRLNDIRENVRCLTEIRRVSGGRLPRVVLNFAMMRRNIAELPDFVRMAKDLGADAVSAGFLIVYSEEMRGESLFYDKLLANQKIQEARAVAAEVGIEFLDMGAFDLDWEARKNADPSLSDSKGRFRSCRELWEFVYFNCLGEVFPCCWHQTPLGDLRKNDFEEIWNGAPYRAYRRGIRKSEPCVNCRHCMLPYLRGCNDIENHVQIFGPDGRLARDA